MVPLMEQQVKQLRDKFVSGLFVLAWKLTVSPIASARVYRAQPLTRSNH
jgi:hypothetical protein